MNKNVEFYDYISWVIDDFEYIKILKILILMQMIFHFYTFVLKS